MSDPLPLLLDRFVHGCDLVAKVRYGSIASLGGLLVGLWMVGRRLGHFIEAAEKQQSAA
jgi:hypothetical protein